jgi:hypothetical protein
MALPKIELPILEMKLPSNGEKIQYRQFTVKEEKILLVAQESKDPEQEIVAAKQVVNNCLLEKDIGELSMFDLEFVLLTLRAKSIDNNISFNITDPETEEAVEVSLNIDEVSLTRDEAHTNRVKINDEYTLFLKYPTIDEFINIVGMNPEDPLVNYFIMVSCLDKVASDDEVHLFSEYKDEEVDDFMGSMTGDVIQGVQKFFETMPKLRHEIKYVNNLGNEKTFVIEGMRTFFI